MASCIITAYQSQSRSESHETGSSTAPCAADGVSLCDAFHPNTRKKFNLFDYSIIPLAHSCGTFLPLASEWMSTFYEDFTNDIPGAFRNDVINRSTRRRLRDFRSTMQSTHRSAAAAADANDTLLFIHRTCCTPDAF